ncbi:amidophosphoribosyltransferase [Candidatus Puniceispirillum marinum]|uniref:Amidophosphoribosyltransferase n=1 Tax=Puniceispirillum marinum (strain IMCC1322) TaxID=488538 RepID=D5BRJ7_PUNMI|nr:amidophosphoribosyltransferase [Candidatus Puniceispirillum marinum]ADE38894.1 Glutamine phosphoribosylpyrophosphate amidotransferase [Candidatus Puniceispirillum marinum IMCC1322]
MTGVSTNPFDDDHFHEECAIFGIYGTPESSVHTALGLHALQHRGQEASGIVSFDGKDFHAHRGVGHVGENFDANSAPMQALKGHIAIGHNRYSTTGPSEVRNIQPFSSELAFGGFALAHNGNLTNAARLRASLVETGSLFQSSTDTEIIVHLVARSHQQGVSNRLIDALKQIEGAYSLVCIADDMLIGVRDPHGVRPLVLGKRDDAYVLSSETCGLDIVGAEFVRDLLPGEMVVIDKTGITSIMPFQEQPSRFCIFEYIYFARPDSILEGRGVYHARKSIGAELATESHVDADLVVPVPDSGLPAAIGYAQAANIPFELGIIRNHYIGRTFIQPTQKGRTDSVKMKHNANSSAVAGKRVILVDDSIVRGTTSRKIVLMMRAAGATEVHMRIASPPTINPCFYGVDTPDKDQLIAAQMSVDDIAKEIGVDSLSFISIDGLYRAMGEARRDPDCPQFCDACFTGDYPIKLATGLSAKRVSHGVIN